jgi:hypothetical protein
LLELIFAGASVALALYQIANSKIKDFHALEEENRKRLIALREEIARNLDTIKQLQKNDTSAQAVYDPVQRALLNALSFNVIDSTAQDFDLLLKNKLKKEPSVKDPTRIFWDIKDAADKLKDLSAKLKEIPKKPAPGTRRILVMRRLPAIQRRLENIDKVLSIIPLSAQGKKKQNARKTA